LSLEPGLVLVTGPNGAGKTNLLESLHVGTQGFSPRTRSDAQLIRRGANASRVELVGRRGPVATTIAVALAADGPKRALLDGAVLRSAEHLRSELATLVFTPDRLVVVKGGPAARRAYLDRSLARLYPARGHIAIDYAAAVGQRNAALRRISAGASQRDALAPWTAQVADLGAMLTAARHDTVSLLQPGFAERAGELGLTDASLGYDAEPVTIAALDARLERDIDRGVTSAGPHLDEIAIRAGERDLRTYGSQGEQRLAVLALLLAEAELIAGRRKVPPLLLLDDALSELDASRRRILSERIGLVGQTIVTATGPEALPLAPAQLLRVRPGAAEAV
jgi:DNA replication and repair protein RecF